MTDSQTQPPPPKEDQPPPPAQPLQQPPPPAEGAPPPYQQQPQAYGQQQPYQQQPGYSTYPQQPGYAQPGQPMYGQPPPPAGAQHTTVMVQQTAAIRPHYGESPCQCQCPYCHQNIVTTLDYRTGTMTWVIAGVLCFIGCDLGCCLIPFCVNGCKDIIHICPNCHQELGRKSRM